MLIFGGSPGVVGTVVDGTTLPFAVAIGGGNVPAFPTPAIAKAILTGFHLAGQSGLGIAHTLRDRIYAYVFGERMGTAEISGLAFAGYCQAVPGNWTGLDAVYAYYEQVRVSTQGVPAQLIFGPATTLYGFLSDLDFRLEDAATGVGAFSLKFRVIPRGATFGFVPPAPYDDPADWSELETGE